MERFLYKHNLSKLYQEKIENLNTKKNCTTMEIEFVSKNLLTKKTPSTDGLIDEFFHLFKEEIAIL